MITVKAYRAAGQAGSTLHAMALQQVYQAKALKELHEGNSDPGLVQELRTATDLTIHATKVTGGYAPSSLTESVLQTTAVSRA